MGPGALRSRTPALVGAAQDVPVALPGRHARHLPRGVLGEQRQVLVQVAGVGQMRHAGDQVADLGLVHQLLDGVHVARPPRIPSSVAA